jgi:hypothetical protein
MRDGYLGVLASRTLGAAAVLRPATPSRFEPEGPQGGGAELGQVVTGMAPPPAAGQIIPAYDALGLPHGDSDDRVGVEARALEPLVHKERQLSRSADLGVTPGQVPALTFRRETEAGIAAGSRRVERGELEIDRVAVAGTRLIDEPDIRLVPVPGPVDPARLPTSTHEALEQAGPTPSTSGAEATPSRSDTMSNRPEPPSRPTVAVRIGRIDVRAVHPAPVAAPTPASRRAAGPSLADHLRARDRGRR